MDIMTTIKSVLAAIGGVLAYVFGPWDTLLIVLLCFVVLDYLTGLINALIKRELDSEVGFKGLAKKVLIFVLVGVAALIDKAVPDLHGALRAAVCMFYIANEGISILENAGKLGLPLPTVLTNALQQLSKKSEGTTTPVTGNETEETVTEATASDEVNNAVSQIKDSVKKQTSQGATGKTE